MLKRKVYLRKNLTNKILWRSWQNLYVWLTVQSDNLYILSRALLTLHKGFRDFQRHSKLLRPLELDFLAKFAKRRVRNNFFLSPTYVVKVFFGSITILVRRDW